MSILSIGKELPENYLLGSYDNLALLNIKESADSAAATCMKEFLEIFLLVTRCFCQSLKSVCLLLLEVKSVGRMCGPQPLTSGLRKEALPRLALLAVASAW